MCSSAAHHDCQTGYAPALSEPVCWFDESGEKTPERCCSPEQLQKCIDGSDPEAWCCTNLADSEADLTATHTLNNQVDTIKLLMIGFGYPLILCLALEGLKGRAPEFLPRSLPARDTLIGYLYAHVLELIVTARFKAEVGQPRPNYYAFRLFADNTASTSMDIGGAAKQSTSSFPSGHSSISCAGMVYTSLVLLELVLAVSEQRKLPPVLRTGAVMLALLPTYCESATGRLASSPNIPVSLIIFF